MSVAHETSTAFSNEVLKEHAVFELSKKEEMKDMLQRYADGQVEMFQKVSLPECWVELMKQAMDDWDRIVPVLQRIRVDV